MKQMRKRNGLLLMSLEEVFVVKKFVLLIRACKRKTRTNVVNVKGKKNHRRARKKKKNNKSKTIAPLRRDVRWYMCGCVVYLRRYFQLEIFNLE